LFAAVRATVSTERMVPYLDATNGDDVRALRAVVALAAGLFRPFGSSVIIRSIIADTVPLSKNSTL
jgi:hypothetical protein